MFCSLVDALVRFSFLPFILICSFSFNLTHGTGAQGEWSRLNAQLFLGIWCWSQAPKVFNVGFCNIEL